MSRPLRMRELHFAVQREHQPELEGRDRRRPENPERPPLASDPINPAKCVIIWIQPYVPDVDTIIGNVCKTKRTKQNNKTKSKVLM